MPKSLVAEADAIIGLTMLDHCGALVGSVWPKFGEIDREDSIRVEIRPITR